MLGKAWTSTHRRWLNQPVFEAAADKVVFGDYMHALDVVDERLKALDAQLEAFSRKEPYAEPVGRLRCYQGIDTVSAMSIVAELYSIRRFETARGLMAYLGLVPSEHSSGSSTRRGAITKAGNRHLRRLLIEAAHHYRHRPAIGPKLRKRRTGQPPDAAAFADRAHLRLHRRYWKLVNAGKPTNVAKTAVARELAGFIWATLYECAVQTAARKSAA